MSDLITLPTGVQLRDPEDFGTLRRWIFDGAKSKLQEAFPISYNGMRLEVADMDYADPDNYSLKDQKKALLSNQFLSRRLRGKLRLIDENTNEPIEEREMTLMRVPYLTERGTFVYNGNEYAHVHQARMMHGAYTRRQNNGDLETQFNTKSGTGPAFRVGFEPVSAQYRLRVGGSNLHLYSLFKDLGVDDDHLAQTWGPEILEMNRAKYDARVFDKAYKNLVPRRAQKAEASQQDKVDAIKGALDSSLVHLSAVQRTLPNMLGSKSASAWRTKIGMRMAEHENISFTPDFEPEETYAFACNLLDPDTFTKVASENGFSPDLKPEEMQEAYNAIYAKVGPQLASMKQWPKEWFAADSDPLGWIGWYMRYGHGERTPDDERQIRRWKSFKARHGAAFVKKPTPRRAFALRYWAIDPMKMITDEAQRSQLEKEMAEYRAEAETAHEEAKMAAFAQAVETVTHNLPKELVMAPANLPVNDWLIGLVKYAEAHTYKGCLMARFSEADAKKVIQWTGDNIPEDQLGEDGYERDVHVTVAYGFREDVTAEELKEAIGKRGQIFVSLKKVHRFPAHEHRPTDCLVVKVDSPALEELHHDLREEFGEKLRVTYEKYNAHMTLAYVQPGSLKSLDDHAVFDGELLPVKEFVFSSKARKEKTVIPCSTPEN